MNAHVAIAQIRGLDSIARTGIVRRIMPTWFEADGPNVPIGTICIIERPKISGPEQGLLAEVIRVDSKGVALVPYSDISNLSVGARLCALSGDGRVPVGDAFLGRAVDALGKAIDNKGAIFAETTLPLNMPPLGALDRETPATRLHTGIRTIDGLLTMGHGQRVGVFAASGVGKTSLMGQLLRQVETDYCVVCLIGERGREVEALWSRDISEEARARTVLVAATSDQAAALRVRAVHQALALASHWRSQGKHVFLLLDSVTRLAMALRELGLAAGEPPTVRAYTPSVFAAIPRVVEQCGSVRTGGSISAVMTVLSETDDVDDPISELMKSLLDGHIVLSRQLAEKGHFPAIDTLRSVSRNAAALIDTPHRNLARKAQTLLAKYETSTALIESGLYTAGSNEEIDAAIAARPALDAFMQQELDEAIDFDAMMMSLEGALRTVHAHA
jgi:flagellum-specific ATP synthase